MRAVPRRVPDLRAFGSVLRSFRGERGYTQEQLSFRSGLTTALISDTENGKRNLSFGSIDRLLGALEVTWEEFGTALTRRPRRKRPSEA